MSDTLTPSGLQSSAGLYGQCGVYQFDRNGAIFNPLDLNPYLLFDAESSMIGTLENPTLDLDPTKQESLDVITATRAGTATFVNLDGEIEIAQPNTVRVDNSLGYPGILVEPSATNTIRWSEDSSGYNYGSGITFESSDVLAPNGQASAFKMTPNDTSSLHRGGALDTAGSWNANDVITYSVWIKTDGYDYILNIGGFFGNEAATFDTLDGSLIGNESNVISASSEDYGNGWFRYVVTYTFQNIITNNYVYSGIRLYKRDASGNATNWDATGETTGVLVYGSQFEAGNVATSYIPTDNDASGVTRAADDLVISGSAFSDFYNQSEGTFYVESVPNENTSGSFLFDLSFGDASTDRLNIFNGSGNQKVFLRTAGTTWSDNIIGSRPAGGVFSRVAISYKTNDVRASLDGVNMTTDPSATISSTLNKMTIGNRYQNPNYLNGRIRRLIFWPYHSDSL